IPKVLPVVWHRLLYLCHAVAEKAAAGHAAETALGVIQIILLLLPWCGSVLLLGMMARRPVRWLLARVRTGGRSA
ncbi:MAG TPA: hypothetical protein VFO16_05270, partial [Pseudonocardiaceae bacterium]|nr:hypothetical protein [Pseudonocardiaceae bacterium]